MCVLPSTGTSSRCGGCHTAIPARPGPPHAAPVRPWRAQRTTLSRPRARVSTSLRRTCDLCAYRTPFVRRWRTLGLVERGPRRTLDTGGDAVRTRRSGVVVMAEESNGAATGGVLLVGSVPLRSAEDVFQVMATELGDRLLQVPDGETGPRADWIVWQYPVLSSRPEFEIGPPGPSPHRALPRLRLRDGESLETLRFDDLGYAAGRHLLVPGVRPAQARRADARALPVPGLAAHAARAHRGLRRPGGPGPRRAALRGAHDARADDDLRRHPARPAGDPVGHELRVRHARRGHADLVRRSALEHRRAARAARAQHPGRREARLPLLPRPRAPPPRPPVRRPAAGRHRQRPVAQPRPLARLDPPAGAGRSGRRGLLRGAGAAVAAAARRGSTSACSTPTTASWGPRPGSWPPSASSTTSAWPPTAGGAGIAPRRSRRCSSSTATVTEPDPAARAAPRSRSSGRPAGSASRPTAGPTIRWTPSARPTTTSTTTAGTATSTRPSRSWRTS